MHNGNPSQNTAAINETLTNGSKNASNASTSSNTSNSSLYQDREDSPFSLLSANGTGQESDSSGQSSPSTSPQVITPIAIPRASLLLQKTGDSSSSNPPAYDVLEKPNNPLSQKPETPSDDRARNDIDDSSNQLIGPDEKTNRFWQKMKYLITKKKIIMPITALITMLSISYITKPFIELINLNNRINIFNILGGVVLASLALFGCWAFIQSFRTKEHKITKRQHNEVLEEVLEKLPNDKLIKYMMVERSNGTRSYFELQTLISQTDKNFSISGGKIIKGHFMFDWLCAISNRRMVVPVLFAALVFGNITFFLTHAMLPESSDSQIFSPANLYTTMVPTLLAFGLMICCIIYNINNTKFEKILFIHNEKNCDPAEAKAEVIQHIENQLNEEDKLRTTTALSSRITRATVELRNTAEYTFDVN